MLDLFRAEWKKTTGNRCLVGCTIWIWPLISLFIMGIVFLFLVFDSDARIAMQDDPTHWDELALQILAVLNSEIVRLVLMGFVAAVFTTEYHHNTWKTILPGNQRIIVILMKFTSIALFIVLAFVITTLLTVMGFGLLHIMFGADFPPALSGSVLSEFLEEFFLNLALTFITMMILIGVAALASIITRSLLFGVVASVGLALMEVIGFPLFILLGIGLLEQEWMIDLYFLSFSFNVSNIQSWVLNDQAIELSLDGTEGNSLEVWQSLAILLFYMCISVGASLFAFQRQDLQ